MSPEKDACWFNQAFFGVLAHALGTLLKYRRLALAKMLTTHNSNLGLFMLSSKFLKFCLAFEAKNT
jgi:hypothetical protein